jgi:hypothetical protein
MKLSAVILEQWEPWIQQVKQLTGFSFASTMMPGTARDKLNNQVHVFADASVNAYAAVAYMRYELGDEVTIQFIQARSRLKPVQSACTIPLMELVAIKLSLSVFKKLNTVFQVGTDSLYIWTDSSAYHNWLRIETRSLASKY